jgi:hypothetical protein
MNCRDLADLLGEFVARELHAEHHAAAQEHLDGCPHCPRLLHSYMMTIAMAGRLQPPAVPAGLLDRLRKHFGEQPPAQA